MREGGREGGKKGKREGGRREGKGNLKEGGIQREKYKKLLCLNKEVSHVGIVLQRPRDVHNYGLHKHSYCNC